MIRVTVGVTPVLTVARCCPNLPLETMNFAIVMIIMGSVFSQSCGPDVIIDDFSVIRAGWLDNLPKSFNALGGDYGSLGAPFTIDTTNKSLRIQARSYPVGIPEAQANPGTAPTFNYWYAKFDRAACFDSSIFSGLSFDIIAPFGSDMNFTMTQMSPNCSYRLVDSQYQLLSKYITPDGTKQTVFLPFSDFSINLNGSRFDFEHLKDWTLVNLGPEGSEFVLSDLKLVGGPVGCIPVDEPKNNQTSNNESKNTTNSNNSFKLQGLLWMLFGLFTVL